VPSGLCGNPIFDGYMRKSWPEPWAVRQIFSELALNNEKSRVKRVIALGNDHECKIIYYCRLKRSKNPSNFYICLCSMVIQEKPLRVDTDEKSHARCSSDIASPNHKQTKILEKRNLKLPYFTKNGRVEERNLNCRIDSTGYILVVEYWMSFQEIQILRLRLSRVTANVRQIGVK
jgi:hypothetical protein